MKDQYILMPKELTAENGAKGLLIGEFSERFEFNCPDCLGEAGFDCELCDGEGVYYHTFTVSWTTIKDIYKMAVKHLSQPLPPKEKETVR
jgi:hypothetical protein